MCPDAWLQVTKKGFELQTSGMLQFSDHSARSLKDHPVVGTDYSFSY
jgi:hypothetical protein